MRRRLTGLRRRTARLLLRAALWCDPAVLPPRRAAGNVFSMKVPSVPPVPRL